MLLISIALFDKNNYNSAMEKRRSRRLQVSLKAERISGNEKNGVFIENISENGIYMLTTPSSTHKKYAPGTDVDLKFRLSSGETLNLRCKVKWSYLKVPPNGLTDCIGLEIIDPPKQYIEFVKALH
ncbi:MAG: PilZ domain-containing protein [Nitrospira sp.]|nr:PilZ domain-containing protein [Nitrospira sp.]